ncbi:HIT family protein [Candidatus Woesearchaeota archaeon]|nr:HIT family protein [Candidatus Woesearchaeota archaeon]
MENCIFCKIVKNESPCWKIYEDKLVIAIFDIYPAIEGHILVIPKKHYKDIYDIPEDLISHISKICKKIALNIKKTIGVEAVNLIQGSGKYAQQDIFHFHMHVIPRRKNDDFKLHYEPKINIKQKFDDLLNKISSEKI